MKIFVGLITLLTSAAAFAQPAQPPARTGVVPRQVTVPDPSAKTPSSNPWDSLPAMSADHCAAEALGTASDPRTGAPVRSSVDPQTGKPLCPAVQPDSGATPPR